jgi:hypothetical protein
MMKLTAQNVALVFRVPMQILGAGDAAPYADAKAAWVPSPTAGVGSPS